jgi:hypothetical protein
MADKVSKICKRISTRTVNPSEINTIQEQLLLAMHYWVVAKQRLQLLIIVEEFMMRVALNQVQVMCQQIKDEARGEKRLLLKQLTSSRMPPIGNYLLKH